MELDIKKYEVLLNVIDQGNLTKASEDLGYTQPAITHMMKGIEREIGVPVLKRSNKGIQLTSEGEDILPLIRELVKANERLNQRCDMLRGLETGRIRIGCFPTVACAWMPKILGRFEKQYPNIQIELLEENSLGRQEEWLSTGGVDICFFSRQPGRTYKWFPMMEDPFYAILPARHPLTAYDRVPVGELQDQTFLACKSKDGLDTDIDRYLRQNHVSVQLKFTSSQDYTIVFMVREGLGISLLPWLMINSVFQTRPMDFVARPLDPPAFRSIGMAVRSDDEISPAMDRFIKCVLSMAPELTDFEELSQQRGLYH